MKLFAISDLHLDFADNLRALLALPPYPQDWLIVAGDVAATEERFRIGIAFLSNRFARVFWTPGNHDLWTVPQEKEQRRGLMKYEHFVTICREYGVLTPEDPYERWPDSDANSPFIAPIFTLYDYSFRPNHVPEETAVQWAEEAGILCTDEAVLHPDPFPSRPVWCTVRCRYTEKRLAKTATSGPLILANHYPLRQDLVYLPRIPRFSLWCGTTRTEDWHTRFPVTAVIHGHLHIRSTRHRDGVRFEEVSLGYPNRQWQPQRGVAAYLRQILPAPESYDSNAKK